MTHVLFDKTGTLTEPAIAQDGTIMRQGIDRDAALAVAAALAQGTRHPLARAFVADAPAALPAVDMRESVAGRGIGGVVGGRRYRLGRADYALPFRAATRPDLEDAVVLADDDGVVAAFHVDERLRPGARAAVDALVRAGIEVAIASGDAKTRVEALAERLGIAAWKARQSPADKLALLASLRAQGARVAVVGDGVNDAPMLAGADVAIAVGTAADAAQAASDIVITGTPRRAGQRALGCPADPLDSAPEPALGALLQHRDGSARRSWLGSAVARGDRNVGRARLPWS